MPKIDINTCNKAELEKIPYIGANKAESIINHRDNVRFFEEMRELNNVHGVSRGFHQSQGGLLLSCNNGEDLNYARLSAERWGAIAFEVNETNPKSSDGLMNILKGIQFNKVSMDIILKSWYKGYRKEMQKVEEAEIIILLNELKGKNHGMDNKLI